MFEHILDCPLCSKRFHYEYDGGEYPAEILCPGCGNSSPSGDYWVLVFCGECHSKLKIPLEIIGEKGNACPKCGTEIKPDFLETIDSSGTTLCEDTRPQSQKRMLQDGVFFDKFKIIKLLGRGGMAEVYLAEHLLLKQQCALKLMQRKLDQDENPVFIKRFVREAKLTHSLNHPNIVKVFDAGSDFKTGYLFLAMEYVEGTTLQAILQERLLSETELLEIAEVMAEALKVLEKANVVHRDIKPSNIMLSSDGFYKLMDLGIAKMESNVQAGDMTLTMEQSTIGTPGYASPEQCKAAHHVDCRSDIFSLGAALYHAASGTVPFKGETPVEVILKTMQNEPEALEIVRPDLSDGFIALISKMMKKNPADRFQNVDELIKAVNDVKNCQSLSLPGRKIKKAIAAINTTFFSSQKSEVEKKSFSAAGMTVKVLLILLTAAVAVLFWNYAAKDEKNLQDKSSLTASEKSQVRKKTKNTPSRKEIVPVFRSEAKTTPKKSVIQAAAVPAAPALKQTTAAAPAPKQTTAAVPVLRKAKPQTPEEIQAALLKSWKQGDWKTVAEILKSGKVSVNLRNSGGGTLLFSACYNVDFQMVKLLLDYGADPNLRGANGYHPLECLRGCFIDKQEYTAKQKEATKIILYLLQKGAAPGTVVNGNPARHGILVEYIFKHPRPDEFVDALLPYLSRMKEEQWKRFVLVSRQEGQVSDRNKYKIMGKYPPAFLRNAFAIICFAMPVTPALLQRFLDSAKGSERFWVTSSQREPVLSLLIRSKQSAEVIETALKAGAYSVCRNWKDERGRSIEKMAPQRIRPLLKRFSK